MSRNLTVRTPMSGHSSDPRIDVIEQTFSALIALLREQRHDFADKWKPIDEHVIVSLKHAEEISGYSSRQLSRLIQQGSITNFGTKHRPKVAVGDLPRKPGMARSL